MLGLITSIGLVFILIGIFYLGLKVLPIILVGYLIGFLTSKVLIPLIKNLF